MEIVLVRHAESEGNRLKVIQGRTDYHLSEMGEKQAELTGKALAGFKADKIYCSPMLRARQTAEAIGNQQGATPEVLDDLREIDLGILEGLTFPEVKDKYPEVFESLSKGALFHSAPEAESEESVKQRARAAVGFLAASKHERLIVVAHLGILERVIARLIRKIMDQDHKQYFPTFLKNCGITHLNIDGSQSRVVEFNNGQHLVALYE